MRSQPLILFGRHVLALVSIVHAQSPPQIDSNRDCQPIRIDKRLGRDTSCSARIHNEFRVEDILPFSTGCPSDSDEDKKRRLAGCPSDSDEDKKRRLADFGSPVPIKIGTDENMCMPDGVDLTGIWWMERHPFAWEGTVLTFAEAIYDSETTYNDGLGLIVTAPVNKAGHWSWNATRAGREHMYRSAETPVNVHQTLAFKSPTKFAALWRLDDEEGVGVVKNANPPMRRMLQEANVEFGPKTGGCFSGYSVIDSKSRCQEAAEQYGPTCTFEGRGSSSQAYPKCYAIMPATMNDTIKVWFNLNTNQPGPLDPTGDHGINNFCVEDPVVYEQEQQHDGWAVYERDTADIWKGTIHLASALFQPDLGDKENYVQLTRIVNDDGVGTVHWNKFLATMSSTGVSAMHTWTSDDQCMRRCRANVAAFWFPCGLCNLWCDSSDCQTSTTEQLDMPNATERIVIHNPEGGIYLRLSNQTNGPNQKVSLNLGSQLEIDPDSTGATMQTIDRTLAGSSSVSAQAAQCTVTRNAALYDHNTERLTGQIIASCMSACLERSWCKSFDWHKNEFWCDLSNKSAADVGGLKTDYVGNPYDHYDCEAPWDTATVIQGFRCSLELWSETSIHRVVAQSRCDADEACKGLMFDGRSVGDGRTVEQVRSVEQGCYQGCGGELSAEMVGAWDTIVKPAQGTASSAPKSEFGPPIGGCHPGYSVIDSPSRCQEAAEQYGLTWKGAGSWPSAYPKCYGKPSTNEVLFNTHPNPPGPEDYAEPTANFCAEAGPCRPGQDIKFGTAVPVVGYGHDDGDAAATDEECDQRCQNTPNCTAWIRPSAGNGNECWMHQGPTQWEDDPLRIAGTPGCIHQAEVLTVRLQTKNQSVQPSSQDGFIDASRRTAAPQLLTALACASHLADAGPRTTAGAMLAGALVFGATGVVACDAGGGGFDSSYDVEVWIPFNEHHYFVNVVNMSNSTVIVLDRRIMTRVNASTAEEEASPTPAPTPPPTPELRD